MRSISFAHTLLLNHPSFFLQVPLLLIVLFLPNDLELPLDHSPPQVISLPGTPAPQHSPENEVGDEHCQNDTAASHVAGRNGTLDLLYLQTELDKIYQTMNMTAISP